jgi:hypothetical protein
MKFLRKSLATQRALCELILKKNYQEMNDSGH